jgi:hypothetical protein
MPKKTEKNLLVGLDIGTSKVVAIVGEVMPDSAIEVVGIGSHPSRGLWWSTSSRRCTRYSVPWKRPS